jgi:hypothetical protein
MKKKLLFLLAVVIAFDFLVTILGQPSSYWLDPRTAHEGNPVFRWFMFQGAVCYFAFIAAYIAGVVGLVSRLPRQTAIVVGLVFLLTHYFAASSWLAFHFHFDLVGPVIYAVVLSVWSISIMRPSDWNACCENAGSRRSI